MTFNRAAAPLFVFLWSSGWITAKLGGLHGGPLTFLCLRLAAAAVLLGMACWLFSWRLPAGRRMLGHALISGVLLHGFHLGGVWWAVKHGVPAGMSGIIAALQPLFTAVIAHHALGERLSIVQNLGLALGFTGVAVAVLPMVLEIDETSLPLLPVAINIIAMASVTLGSVYQKRFLSSGDLRGIAAIQFTGGLLVTLPAALLLENEPIIVDWAFVSVLAWAVLGNSISGILLWLHLVRQGEVSTVMSLMYLIPPMVAIQSALMFGEIPTTAMIAGSVIAMLGVYLTTGRRTTGST